MTTLFSRLMALNPLDYPPTLAGGGLTLALFQLAHHFSQEAEDEVPNNALILVSDLANNPGKLTPGFLNGDMGVLWAVGYLVDNGILEPTPSIMKMAYGTLNRNSSYFFDSPVRFNPFHSLYPFGVGMMPLLADDDTAAGYEWQEQLILRLCDCERILTESFPGIHSPGDLSASMLHSILAFARQAYVKGVFPFKAAQLCEIIAAWPTPSDGSEADLFILNTMCGRTAPAPEGSAEYVALMSVIYREPSIFRSYIKKYPINVKSTGPATALALMHHHE